MLLLINAHLKTIAVVTSVILGCLFKHMQLQYCKIGSRVHRYRPVTIVQCSVRIAINSGLRNGWTKWKK